MNDHDDKGQSLHDLSLRNRASIVTQLVEIGRECNQREHAKRRSFIGCLQCLQPKDLRLCRTSINAFNKQEQGYVALSYIWEPSKHEDPKSGRYLVEGWNDTCDVACTRHTNCAQKRDALQAMDLVYQLSEHPVALLGRPLETESDLHLLGRILSGDLFRDDPPELRAALRLLHVITQERWWDRA
ncbi:hypothetical protein F4802DRAFT_597988 [Xylaria palmicola]|nr:hypothetical protein F4802DRAFT_597988 [Xylaria palmicola]